MTYQRKPLRVKAYQWDGNASGLASWCAVEAVKGIVIVNGASLLIPTLTGQGTAELGDYVVKGIGGEIYPVREDTFEVAYQAPGAVTPGPIEPVPVRDLAQELDDLKAEVNLLKTTPVTEVL